jgi:3-dehydroquinate dehydratase-1
LLVGTVDRFALLEEYAGRPAAARAADIVEVRLDLFDKLDIAVCLPACERLEATGTPVLITIRPSNEGGRWRGTDADRCLLFEAALGVVSWVDVELASGIGTEVIRMAHLRGKRAVVSYHNFEETPPLPRLQQIAADARDQAADIVKLACMVNGPADHDALVELTRAAAQAEPDRLCVIGMGEKGVSLRVLLPTVGSVLAYASVAEAVAPGQLSESVMVDRLRMECPPFNQRYLARVGAAAPR